MNNYEIMFILRPDLAEQEKKDLINQLHETLTKSGATIINAAIWAERRRLYFPLSIKGKGLKFREGLYYLVECTMPPLEVRKVDSTYRLNENILRFLITAKDEITPKTEAVAKPA